MSGRTQVKEGWIVIFIYIVYLREAVNLKTEKPYKRKIVPIHTFYSETSSLT